MTKCIYKLYFAKTPDKIYVGSSNNFEQRLRQHIQELIGRKHPNIFLQRDFSIYGLINLRWEILEKCCYYNENKILELENKYIQKLKSNTNGYNIAVSTNNGKLNIIASDINLNEMKKYIEEYTSKHKIYIKEIKTGKLKNLNNKYTKYWYNNQTEDYISEIFCNASSYFDDYVEDGRKKMIVILNNFEEEYINNILQKKNKTNEFINAGINRLLDIKNYNKYCFKHIILLSALNPYHMDLGLLKTPEDKSIYKIFTLLRYITPVNMNKTFTIHIPTGLFNYYKDYFEVIGDKNE